MTDHRYEQLTALLSKHGQTHLLRFWPTLPPDARTRLAEAIEAIDWSQIAAMQACLHDTGDAHSAKSGIQAAPVPAIPDPTIRQALAEGQAALTDGKVAVLLVAGGQGSRLGFNGPKGAFPVAPVSGATLFEIHARKILALETRYRCEIPFCIMTSQANDGPTRAFFERHAFFGLQRERVNFFTQGMLPALWPDGRLILETADRPAMAPDGHGGVIAAMRHAALFDRLDRRGVETLFYFQVDNPMVAIADPVFIGHHRRQSAQMSLKVCAKRDPHEGLGVVAQRDGRTVIVEYTELTDAQKTARQADGSLTFGYGSVAIHAFALDFLARQADHDLPLHRAHKKIAACDEAGQPVTPDKPNGYKFERFIFDVLPRAERVMIMPFDRKAEFAPVKNADGEDSPATAQQAMIEAAARQLESAGVTVPRDRAGHPRHRIEIDPACPLDPAILRARLGPDLILDGDIHIR